MIKNHKHHKMDINCNPKSNSLGFFGILKQSLKTTNRNGKLLFPILLLVFLSFSQLDFAQNYLLDPIAKDFSSQVAKHPNFYKDFNYNIDQTNFSGIRKDIRETLLIKLIILAFTSIISLVFLVATVSSSYEAYTAKVLGPKDIFLKIKKLWKKPLVTSFYMILITLGIICVYVISIGLISVIAVNSSWIYLFYGVISLSLPVLYFYMTALWMISLVVSVLEDGFGGLKAICRAKELLKGKKLQASLMAVPFVIVYGVVRLMANSLVSYDLSRCTKMAIEITFSNALVCVLKLLVFVVYTVFYHERKKSLDEKEVKGFYVPIAAGEA